VVHDGRAVTRASDLGELGDVRGENFHACWHIGSAASADGSHSFPSRRQVPGHGEPERTRPENDVKAPAFVHGSSLLLVTLLRWMAASTPSRTSA